MPDDSLDPSVKQVESPYTHDLLTSVHCCSQSEQCQQSRQCSQSEQSQQSQQQCSQSEQSQHQQCSQSEQSQLCSTRNSESACTRPLAEGAEPESDVSAYEIFLTCYSSLSPYAYLQTVYRRSDTGGGAPSLQLHARSPVRRVQARPPRCTRPHGKPCTQQKKLAMARPHRTFNELHECNARY